MVPTRLALVRRMGSIDLDLTRARFAGSIVVIELDMKFGSLDLRLPDGASASIDDLEVIVGSARDHRKDAPAEGRPHVDPDRAQRLRLGRHPRAAPGRLGRLRARLARLSSTANVSVARAASRSRPASTTSTAVTISRRPARTTVASARAGPSTIGARKCTFMSAVVTSSARDVAGETTRGDVDERRHQPALDRAADVDEVRAGCPSR